MSETVQIQTKFDMCKHRSTEPVKKIIKRCSCKGGDYVKEGFFCSKRQIFGLNHTFCESCEVYESK
jgi:hypothetical protein